MKQIIITINTENASFVDHSSVYGELADILTTLGTRLEWGDEPESLKDSNGNTVGTVEYACDD